VFCREAHSIKLTLVKDSILYEKQDLCGKKVFITNTQNGKSVTVTVADECPTCNNANSIDLSHGAFGMIADYYQGEVPIKWEFV
jgi:expansin (peptidoglycan-binding protein)